MQDAKARFDELLDACVNEGPQLVTKHGIDTAVLVPIKEWNRMSQVSKPSLKSLLLSEAGRSEMDMPERAKPVRRFGSMKGKIRIADDFDSPLPEDVLAAFEGN